MLEGLPDPVQRYFGYTLKDGQEYIRFVKMKARGKFRLPLTKEMKTLTSQTYFSADRPGFAFDAVIRFNTYIWADIRDKYYQEKGDMFVNLCSVHNVLNESDIQDSIVQHSFDGPVKQ